MSKVAATPKYNLAIKAIEALRHVTDFGGGGGFAKPQPKKPEGIKPE